MTLTRHEQAFRKDGCEKALQFLGADGGSFAETATEGCEGAAKTRENGVNIGRYVYRSY